MTTITQDQASRPALADAALDYAARGWPVFPCRPGRKEPATAHGVLDATTDPVQIRAWWQATPDANIGIATGAPGPDVLDVDKQPGADGFGALAELAQAGLLDGHGPIIETRSGGWHVYFAGTGQRNGRIPGRHLDFRAAGGYVIAPPSRVEADAKPGGHYTELRPGAGEPAELDWRIVRDLLDPPPGPLPFQQPPRDTAAPAAGRPGDDYAASTSWPDILAPHGWRMVRQIGGVRYWCRPGKTGRGVSASTRDDGGFWAFTTSTDFEPERLYSKFGAYAVLAGFGGDHQAAAAQLRRDGYGSQPAAQPSAPAAASVADSPDGAGAPAAAGRQVVVTLASAIKPRPVRWLWPDRIPAGALTLLGGREGIGKSLVVVHLAAQLTRGTLPGSRHGRPSRVLFATSEDAWEFTMVPRLIAAGADLAMIGRVQVENAGMVTGLSMPADVPALGAYMTDHDVALLALDPLTSVMDGRIDAHRDREVRSALEPLGQLAEDTGAAAVGLVHLGKAAGRDPVNLILGSRAFSAVARVAMIAARDPDDETTNVLSVEKSNVGRLDVPGLTYRIDGVEVPTDEGAAPTGLLVWTGETDRRVRDIMADADGEQSERDEAAEWLTGYLADSGGEAAFADITKAARANGHAERTLRRAAKRAGIKIASGGFPRRTVWTLPDAVRPQSGQCGQDMSPGRTVAGLDDDDSAATVRPQCGQDTKAGRTGRTGPAVAALGDPALGPCLQCRELCNRYGDGGRPLCDDCASKQPGGPVAGPGSWPADTVGAEAAS